MIMSINQRLRDLGFRVVARTGLDNGVAISDVKSLPKRLTVTVSGSPVNFKLMSSQPESDMSHASACYFTTTKLCDVKGCVFSLMIDPRRDGDTRVSIHALDREVDEDERFTFKMVTSDTKLSDVLARVVPELLTKRLKRYVDSKKRAKK
jgi:hypothetical protein